MEISPAHLPSTPLPSSTPSASIGPSTIPPQSSANDFAFPSHAYFPPFYTLQPNLTTLSRQLALWSSLIQAYCSHHRQFRLSLADAANTPLFHNARINRRLDLLSIRRVFDHMASADGDRRAEWVLPASGKAKTEEHNKNVVWVYWRRPEEWADAVYNWVDGTGQRGSVLTVYELREGEETGRQEWTGMDEEMFRRCLDVLVKRGKAQIFGAEDGAGVKFF